MNQSTIKALVLAALSDMAAKVSSTVNAITLLSLYVADEFAGMNIGSEEYAELCEHIDSSIIAMELRIAESLKQGIPCGTLQDAVLNLEIAKVMTSKTLPLVTRSWVLLEDIQNHKALERPLAKRLKSSQDCAPFRSPIDSDVIQHDTAYAAARCVSRY